MSWLQILVLGAAVGFGEIFPLSGSGISVPVRQLLGCLWTARRPAVQCPAPHCRVAGRLPGAPAGAVELLTCLFFAAPASGRAGAGGNAAAPPSGPPAAPGDPPNNSRPSDPGPGNRAGDSAGRRGISSFEWPAPVPDGPGWARMRDVRSATVADGLCMGLAQALSIIPGLSRTGLTISAGILQGLEPEFSWNFSFLLAVPAMLLCSP